MYFRTALLATAALLSLTAALPAAAPEGVPPKLRRAFYHLTNCNPFSNSPHNYQPLSLVVYCEIESDCTNTPDPSNVCIKDGGSDYFHWEGQRFDCTFPSGTNFSWSLPEDAQSKDVGALIDSSGSDGIARFDGFKDDQGDLFSYERHDCKSIYYYNTRG